MKSIKLVLCVLVALGLACGIAACAWAEVYPRAFTVEGLDYSADLITFSDMAGRQWLYYGCEDWSINDMAAAIMDDNGTPDNIFDDIIIKVYYQTNIDSWFEPDEVWDK